ncbi:MAG TPA: hypothetical protein VGM02_03205 [Acidobacteriaceae bacterium]|jgi:hypothetical protein
MKSLLLLFALVVAYQTALGRQTKPDQSAAITPPAPGIFYKSDLRLHFYYPVEMVPSDLVTATVLDSTAGIGKSQPGDSERDGSEACLRTMLRADLPADKADTRMATLGAIENTPSPEQERIAGTIWLFDVDMDCVCAAMRKKRDAAMRDISATITQAQGMTRMGPPLWYDLGKQKIHMSAAVGRHNPSERPVLVMDMVTDYHGHVLMWIVQSNDAETFNTLTKSTVQFDKAPALPLFPADVGPQGFGGVPMKILPR